MPDVRDDRCYYCTEYRCCLDGERCDKHHHFKKIVDECFTLDPEREAQMEADDE